MRLILVLIAGLWGIGAVLLFAKAQETSADARLTASFIILWPVLVVILLLNEPVPMWIAVPAMFGFIPWLLAGPHLWGLLKGTKVPRPDEVMGIPKGYWLWGGLSAVALGILFTGSV